MASVFAHIVVPAVTYAALKGNRFNVRLLVLAMVLAVLPDIDVLAFKFGIAYGHEGRQPHEKHPQGTGHLSTPRNTLRTKHCPERNATASTKMRSTASCAPKEQSRTTQNPNCVTRTLATHVHHEPYAVRET